MKTNRICHSTTSKAKKLTKEHRELIVGMMHDVLFNAINQDAFNIATVIINSEYPTILKDVNKFTLMEANPTCEYTREDINISKQSLIQKYGEEMNTLLDELGKMVKEKWKYD